jgi:hypothetical protein
MQNLRGLHVEELTIIAKMILAHGHTTSTMKIGVSSILWMFRLIRKLFHKNGPPNGDFIN